MNIQDLYFQNHPGAKSIGSPGDLISALLPNILIASGIVLLILTIFSGFNLLSDAGSGNQQTIAKHRQALTWGVIGFLIVISAYFILQIVGFGLDVDFTNLDILNQRINPVL